MAEENIMLVETDVEYTLIDVVEAAKNMGLNSVNVQTLRNFLILNDDYFDSDDYCDFIDIINEIKDLYYNPVAEELFGKTADKLTEAERYDVIDAMSNEDRRSILDTHIEAMRDHGILATMDIDANGYAVWYWSLREAGSSSGSSGSAGSIRYDTEHGTRPDPVEGLTVTEEHLPTITADGYVHTGWVDYIGDPVEVGQVFSYSPTLVAVWEEAPVTVDYIISYASEHSVVPVNKTVTVNYGESYTLTAADLPTLEADGYTFQGWTSNGSAVAVGDTIEADTVLTAVWEASVSHVVESKGDGFTLFNGVKLPSLPEYDIEKYPYAMLIHLGTTTVRLFITSTYPYTWSNSKQALEYETHFRDGWNMKIGDVEWKTMQTNYQASAGTALESWKPIWANYDIINTTDNSVYLAASEPIALDGMNVIEWDGNTEGLEKFGTSPFYRVSSVTDVDVSKNVCALRKTGSGIITINTPLSESDNYYGNAVVRYVSNASETYPYEGVYLAKSGEIVNPLFAYYPIKQEPTDDTNKGKLLLLSRMFSKPIFHAMTGKWFWYE